MKYLKTPLVNLIDVQDLCGLSRNIEEKEYNRFILTSQNTMLRELLGEDLVNALVDHVCLVAEDANLEILLETYVKPTLSHDSFVHYTTQSSMKSLKSGVKRTGGENTENGSANEYSAVTSLHQKNVDSYVKRMICYLEENLDLFLTYETKTEPIQARSIFTTKG
jgi:hypothetical protein